jgi:hypothetical protein
MAVSVMRAICFLFLTAMLSTICFAQMKTGSEMPGFAEVFGLQNGRQATGYKVEEIAVQAGSNTMANVLWPQEKLSVTLHFTNQTRSELKAHGRVDVVSYGTSVPPGDVWVPHVFKIAEEGSVPITIDVPAAGSQDVTIQPQIPERFGGYALIADVDGYGRSFAATVVRAIQAEKGRVQYPTYALDMTWDEFMNEGIFVLFEKLGVKGARMGASYEPKSEATFAPSASRLDRYMNWAQKHDVTVMLTLGAGDGSSDQPLGRPRPWLDSENRMQDTKDDRAWLPAYDDDFKNWVQQIATHYGWPKGNLNAVELWNEPWEGISISGWGADIPRYRDIFTHMAEGVEAARKRAGVEVLIGGTCSSSNARDKLFPDGSDHFLKWLDFVSIHYQALAADPSLVPEWIHRTGPHGSVRVWDTESWIANSEDRVAGVIASMRAQGQSRTAGIFDGNVYQSKNVKLEGHVYPVVQAWSPAAAVAASQKFIGQRAFRQLLFKNGLPWVFVFDGLQSDGVGHENPEDGTVVILGDMKRIYDPARTLFRSVEVAEEAHLTIKTPRNLFQLYDFYGNPVSAKNGAISVPLNGLGYFLRTNGERGSFEGLLTAIKSAQIEGYSPVEIVAHDLTTPVKQNPVLRLTVTDILNRDVSGRLETKLAGLTLNPASATIHLKANETQDFTFAVKSGKPVRSNLYHLSATFSGDAGKTLREEDLHVNYIARRTIKVDGDLNDWRGVLPQVVPGISFGPNLTQEAWLPFKEFGTSVPNGLATAYLAYDDNNFYFAAKVADTTPDAGMVRFAKRDDDSYFYPEEVSGRDGEKLTWPIDVRHYSYRRNFDIPSGSGEHDNVLIAFNVFDNKPWLPNPPGVMPHFITYWDTDYEFALNPVAAQYGGGTEIWRLLAPGMPRKHFFPRQPSSVVDGGAVADAQLVIRREGNTRLVEAAIPWKEIPEVRRRILAGQTVKFSCRVNDNQGPAHELAAGRSVSKSNSVTFHDDWQEHWANEVEFGAEK